VASWGKTLNSNWLSADEIPWEKTKHRYSLWVPTQPDRVAAEKEIEKIFRNGVDEMLAKRKKGQPFCYVVGPIGAHRPFSKGTGKSLWGIDPDNLKGKMPAFLPDVAEAREDMADALGEICATDLYIGWILDELRKSGELDNTLVVLTGDNGMGMPRAKAHVYDMGVRAPLIVRWPNGISKPGRTVSDFVNIVDLAPTFLELAGAEMAKMDGRSLLPLLKSESDGVVDPKRDFVVVGRERHEPNARPGGLPYPVRAIRTADFLYVRNFKPDRWPSGDPSTKNFPTDPSERGSGTIEWIISHRDETEPVGQHLFALNYGKRPAEELYNLRNDPDEVKNVADDPAFSEAKKSLSERLLRIMRLTKDPRLTDAFDRPPYYRGKAGESADAEPEKISDKADNDPDCVEHVRLNE
jgi:arylsulfatase A-like enzyme